MGDELEPADYLTIMGDNPERTKVLAAGLIAYRMRLWARVAMRKTHRCKLCDKRLPAGGPGYRPMREGPRVGRYERICVGCAEASGAVEAPPKSRPIIVPM